MDEAMSDTWVKITHQLLTKRMRAALIDTTVITDTIDTTAEEVVEPIGMLAPPALPASGR